MNSNQHHDNGSEFNFDPVFARNGGAEDAGLNFDVKTKLPEDLYNDFIVYANSRGGAAACLRDFVSCVIFGKTYVEHVAERRRAVLFGKGHERDPFRGLRGGGL